VTGRSPVGEPKPCDVHRRRWLNELYMAREERAASQVGDPWYRVVPGMSEVRR
jgi:hypothetical protein